MDEFEGIKLITESNLLNNHAKTGMDSFYQTGFDTMLKELIRLQDELYFTKDHETKHEIKQQIQEIYDRCILHQLEANPAAVENYKNVKTQSSKPFVLWQLSFPKVFMDNNGFDIVIGNPPYVDSEEMTRSMPIDREIYTRIFSCTKGNWDLFVPFIEKGIKLLKKNGVQTYIVPNKLVSAPYTTALRKKMAENVLLELRDYSNVNVFKSAAVYPVVFRLKKSSAKRSVIMDVMSEMTVVKNHNEIPTEKFYTDIGWDRYFNASAEVLALIDKISSFPRLDSIADVNGAATVGEAYLIKNFIFDNDGGTKDVIKFINTGGIDKFKSFYGIEYIRYLKGKYLNPVVNSDDLKNMSEKRLSESKSEKIIIGGMNKQLECLYDKGEYLAGKSTTIVYNNKHLKYITAVLNSTLMSFYYAKYYNSMSLAGGFFRIGAPQIKSLPIAFPNNENIMREVEELVEDIQLLMRTNEFEAANVQDIYHRIDSYVYDAYGLDNEELRIILYRE